MGHAFDAFCAIAPRGEHTRRRERDYRGITAVTPTRHARRRAGRRRGDWPGRRRPIITGALDDAGQRYLQPGRRGLGAHAFAKPSGRPVWWPCASSSRPRNATAGPAEVPCEFTRAQWWPTLALGLGLAAMNLTLYISIDRIGLGLAATLEFLGPLAVALFLVPD